MFNFFFHNSFSLAKDWKDIKMSSNNSYSPINITSSVDNSPTSPKLPTPTPKHEPVYKWDNYRTGYIPESKKAKRGLFISPDTKRKIDEIHHFQQQQIDLPRELYFEQKITARRLSFLEQIGLRFCGSKKNDVADPYLDPSVHLIHLHLIVHQTIPSIHGCLLRHHNIVRIHGIEITWRMKERRIQVLLKGNNSIWNILFVTIFLQINCLNSKRTWNNKSTWLSRLNL